jgi:hypothetical protein
MTKFTCGAFPAFYVLRRSKIQDLAVLFIPLVFLHCSMQEHVSNCVRNGRKFTFMFPMIALDIIMEGKQILHVLSR